jgi:hypothetical protein
MGTVSPDSLSTAVFQGSSLSAWVSFPPSTTTLTQHAVLLTGSSPLDDATSSAARVGALSVDSFFRCTVPLVIEIEYAGDFADGSANLQYFRPAARVNG